MYRSRNCHSHSHLAVLGWLLLCSIAYADDDGTGIAEIDTNAAEEAAAAEAGEGDAAEDELAEIVFGEPQACILAQRIRRTEILSDYAVLFHMSGNQIYLNRLARRCSGLRIAGAFGYEVRTSQLCNVDVIRVVDSFGGGLRSGITCGLGPFLPVTEEQVPLLREMGPRED